MASHQPLPGEEGEAALFDYLCGRLVKEMPCRPYEAVLLWTSEKGEREVDPYYVRRQEDFCPVVAGKQVTVVGSGVWREVVSTVQTLLALRCGVIVEWKDPEEVSQRLQVALGSSGRVVRPDKSPLTGEVSIRPPAHTRGADDLTISTRLAHPSRYLSTSAADQLATLWAMVTRPQLPFTCVFGGGGALTGTRAAALVQCAVLCDEVMLAGRAVAVDKGDGVDEEKRCLEKLRGVADALGRRVTCAEDFVESVRMRHRTCGGAVINKLRLAAGDRGTGPGPRTASLYATHAASRSGSVLVVGALTATPPRPSDPLCPTAIFLRLLTSSVAPPFLTLLAGTQLEDAARSLGICFNHHTRSLSDEDAVHWMLAGGGHCLPTAS